MKPSDLVLRCLAEKKGDQWQAFCLDLCLAAQADTFEEAKQKIESMIRDYVNEAMDEDKEFCAQLLKRRAPTRDWVKYYTIAALFKIGVFHINFRRVFREVMPCSPHKYNHA